MRRRHLNFPLSIFNFQFQNRRPRHSVAPPLTQRGTYDHSSPIVGEGYSREQWLDGIARSESVPTCQLHKTGNACVLPRLPQGRRLASTIFCNRGVNT